MERGDKIKEIIDFLQELKQDDSVPRNVKERIGVVESYLKNEKDIDAAIDKSLHELDEIVEDVNIQPYTRTQIWNVVSMLEKVS